MILSRVAMLKAIERQNQRTKNNRKNSHCLNNCRRSLQTHKIPCKHFHANTVTVPIIVITTYNKRRITTTPSPFHLRHQLQNCLSKPPKIPAKQKPRLTFSGIFPFLGRTDETPLMRRSSTVVSSLQWTASPVTCILQRCLQRQAARTGKASRCKSGSPASQPITTRPDYPFGTTRHGAATAEGAACDKLRLGGEDVDAAGFFWRPGQ